MFEFPPMTEEEINAINVIEDGVYNFEVIKAQQKTSKSGNQMIELVLKVWDKAGLEHQIFDYLVSMKSMMFKVKHFCDATGLEEKYKAGKFYVEDCLGKSGKAEIIIQEGQLKQDGSRYPTKNSVKDYVMTDQGAVKHESPKGADFHDDKDIPF